jgi:hypothetical protein
MQCTDKDHQGQTHGLMEPPTTDSHGFSQATLHHEEQIQRVVSPANQAALAHYQAQYAGYEAYHRQEMDVTQHDPRQVQTTLT